MIVDSATDYAIISTGRDGNVTSWSEGAHRIFGWSRVEMIGRPSQVVFTPEDIAAGVPAKEIAQALAEGRSEDERWHIRRDGSRFWASGMMIRLASDEGEDFGFAKILRDRTAQREMEVDLQEARERLTSLVELASVGIAQCDSRGTIVLANGAFCALLGRDRTDVTGRSFADLWDRETRDRSAALR
jgi:PAS domain S-box-containing protein